MSTTQEEIPVRMVSMVGAKDRAPYVIMTIGDARPLTFNSEKAKEIGSMLIETAMAADGDAFLAEWAVKDVGCDDPTAAQLIRAFRDWRVRRGERGGQ